jgi:hypothetical protein
MLLKNNKKSVNRQCMEDVGGKLDAMEKKISKLYAKVFQK